MSVEFDLLQKASGIPEVISAIRYANKKGVVMVAASGNDFVNRVTYPARDPRVIAVGATTDNLCKADYSNTGKELDIVAPGGGDDAAWRTTPRTPRTATRRSAGAASCRRRSRRASAASGSWPTRAVVASPHVSARSAC